MLEGVGEGSVFIFNHENSWLLVEEYSTVGVSSPPVPYHISISSTISKS